MLALACFISGAIFAAWMVYTHTLVKRNDKMWGRQISEPGNQQLEEMWEAGIEWSKQNIQYKKDVQIENDGLKLVGEFYDFGFDKTVVILPGRRECLIYSYFYAMPYKDAGINVLVIDHRAHGLSEGKYSTAGIKEAEDVIVWIKHMHDNYNQNTMYIHGICVGTCCATNILKNPECPEYVKAAVYDSCFINYKEIFGNHMMELGHKLWPTFPIIWWHFKRCTGCDINDSQPLKYIDQVKVPVCFIWGKKDVYCLPEKSELIWEKCKAPEKECHWFEEGTHSKLRHGDPKEYDSIVKEFFKKH